MSVKTGALSLPGRKPARLRAGAIILIPALVVIGLIAASLALRESEPGNRGIEGSASTLSSTYSSQSVVTGTGPGLVHVAGVPGAAYESVVTGTGPGLVHVAGVPGSNS